MTAIAWDMTPALPGELMDELDFTPEVGGCGRALYTAGRVLIGDRESAIEQMTACLDCRAALLKVADAAGLADTIASFESVNTETPHAASPASIAA